MKVFISTIFIMLSFSVVAAAEITIDASSPNSFTTSLSKMAKELDEQQQMELVKALMKISLNVDVGDTSSIEETTKRNQEEVAKILNGKSLREIISIASKLKGNEEMEQAIDDMGKMGTSAEYQHDADIVRLNDVKLFGSYLQKYYKIAGHYPLQGASELPVYVHLATKEQEQFTKSGPGHSHTEISLETLIKEMGSVLKEEIIVPFDPQHRPANKPNFYIYMITGDTFYFAVHLHQSYSFTRKVDDYYHKLEISNKPDIGQNILKYDDLLKNKAFTKALEEKMIKPDYFKHVREEQQKEWQARISQ